MSELAALKFGTKVIIARKIVLCKMSKTTTSKWRNSVVREFGVASCPLERHLQR